MFTDYQRNFISRIRSMPLTPNPPGWRLVATIPVGGLLAAGFVEDSHALIIASHNGRCLVDSRTGERLARDYDASMTWYKLPELTVEGIGSALGRHIPVAGVNGGGLNLTTPDSWSVEAVWPDWPDGDIILGAPLCRVYQETRAAGCYKIARIEGIKAYGFSAGGDALVVAESHTLRLWGRDTQKG